MGYVIKGIGSVPLPAGFDCTEPALNDFLLKYAAENESLGLSSTHLFCYQDDGQDEPEILGYFSLATTVIDVGQLPKKLTKRYPNYVKQNLTVTLLARLALDKQHQGKKLGGLMLVHMINTAVMGWKYVNSIGLLTHAKNEKVAKFYEYYGFMRLPENPLHLFIPRKDVISLEQQSRALPP
jgi:GNAT superfamily N-acetyltransferase